MCIFHTRKLYYWIEYITLRTHYIVTYIYLAFPFVYSFPFILYKQKVRDLDVLYVNRQVHSIELTRDLLFET